MNGQHSAGQHVGAYLLGGSGSGVEAFLSPFYFGGLGDVGGASVAAVGLLNGSVLKPDIVSPTSTTFDGDWLMPITTNFFSATRPRVAPMWVTYQEYQSINPEQVLAQADYFRLVTPHQTPIFDSTLPFFYRDNAREYFVVPTIYYQNGNYFTINAPEYVYDPFYKAEYRFWPFYHAFTPLLVSQLNFGGTDALYRRELQLDPASVAGVAPFDFSSYYLPTSYVLSPPPQEAIDFDSDAGYSLYNWELFYHAPFLIANSLSTNQQFEEAKRWYEYVFNPAGSGTDPVPQRYWITKPFYQMTAADYAQQQITALMQGINQNDPALEHQVARWRADPFDPDAIAQFRPVAYQRAIVMRYIDNLIAWGDQLFTQDTMETINLATQLYVLAGDLLGPRPEIVPPRVEPVVQTYAELMQGNLDAFSNELVAAENVIPPVNVNVPTPGGSQSLPNLNTLYFQIPPNSQLLGYWDTVADRLFKIRHCMNIEGVVQQLPLVRAARSTQGCWWPRPPRASTSPASSATSTPPRRPTGSARSSGKALELCDQVRGLGAELLAALEKSDAEAPRADPLGAEKQLQAAIDDVRARQIDAANQEIDVLAKARQGVSDRLSFYAGPAADERLGGGGAGPARHRADPPDGCHRARRHRHGRACHPDRRGGRGRVRRIPGPDGEDRRLRTWAMRRTRVPGSPG